MLMQMAGFLCHILVIGDQSPRIILSVATYRGEAIMPCSKPLTLTRTAALHPVRVGRCRIRHQRGRGCVCAPLGASDPLHWVWHDRYAPFCEGPAEWHRRGGWEHHPRS